MRRNNFQSEKSIQLGIMQALGFKGWRVKRAPPSIYASKGWPDLVAIKNGLVVFIECKSQNGKLSPDQRRFGQDIELAGGVYIVARSVEYAVECCENIEIVVCDGKGNPSQAIKPVKGMKLMSNNKKSG